VGVRRKVELRIEELVLYGFPPCDRHRIGDAATRELARLFAERGAPPSSREGGEVASLSAGSFEARPDLGAERIGVQVARAVYGGLSG
jgi:hypothetical protein